MAQRSPASPDSLGGRLGQGFEERELPKLQKGLRGGYASRRALAGGPEDSARWVAITLVAMRLYAGSLGHPLARACTLRVHETSAPYRSISHCRSFLAGLHGLEGFLRKGKNSENIIVYFTKRVL